MFLFLILFSWVPHWKETRRVTQKNSYYFQWELNQFALQYQKQKDHTKHAFKNWEQKDVMFQSLSLVEKMR